MRRLAEDQRALQESLLSLTPPRRLFVQRWMELFDREAVYGVRARPISYDSVVRELAAHTRNDYHISIIKDERAASTVPQLKEACQKIDRDPLAAAEAMGASLLSTGFHPSFLYHAFKLLLSPPTLA